MIDYVPLHSAGDVLPEESYPIGTQRDPHNRAKTIDIYDFFSGCGGTSAGLSKAGLVPRLAIDFDRDALATYAHNFPDAKPLLRDITKLHTNELEPFFEKERKNPVLFCACAPCQPFSKQNRQKKSGDDRALLLSHLRRFLERFRPELLIVENVPGIRKGVDEGSGPLAELEMMLRELGYWFDHGKIYAPDFGVPQSRYRLIVVASLFGPISLPAPTHGSEEQPHLTVSDAIATLPALAAGSSDSSVKNHKAAGLAPRNLLRIRATKTGGDWRNWDPAMRLDCHEGVEGYTDVYGRMAWDRPAPTLTTRCISLSNGRFGHPEQDRAISVREAACLQTFDLDFEFKGSMAAMARQIGNAVPVALAAALGKVFQMHVAEQAVC